MSGIDNIGNGSSGSYVHPSLSSTPESAMDQKTEEARAPATTIYFPSDLQNSQFYPEQIKISIYERQGVSLDKITAIVKGDIKKFTNTASTNKEIEEQAAKDANGKPDTDQGRTKPSVGEAVVETFGKIGGELKEGLRVRQSLNTKLVSAIYLPMPKEMVHNESVSWEGADLGSMGAILKGDIAGGAAAGALGMAAIGAGGAAGGILGKLMGSGAGGMIAGAFASDGFQKGIESLGGIKANPYKEQTFQGIPFRKFSFSFTFNPRSQEEVKRLDNIVQNFRAYSKPSMAKTGKGGIFKYPHEFQIEFLTTDTIADTLETNYHLPQLKYCVCTGVNTNFATKEWRAFEGGAPVEVSLQIDFEETELITQEDVLGKTVSGRFKDNKEGRRF